MKHIEHLEGTGHLENPIDGALLGRVQYVIDIWEEVLRLPGGETLAGNRDVRGSVRGSSLSSLTQDQDVMLFLDGHQRKILIQVINGGAILPRGGLAAQ